MFTSMIEFFFGKRKAANTQAVDTVIKISTPTATTRVEKVEDDISNIANNAPDKHKANVGETPATPKTAKPKVSKPRAKKQGS